MRDKGHSLRTWLASMITFCLLTFGVFGWIYLRPSQPDSSALEAMESNDRVNVTKNGKWISFSPGHVSAASSPVPTIILYPGAMIQPASYSPLAQKLAANGYTVYLIKMPFDLAVFGGNRAEAILRQIEQDSNPSYVIGGHSLGGMMAARYAVNHKKNLKGVFLLASYPDRKGNLKDSGIPVISFSGSEDGYLNTTSYEEAKLLLPDSTQFIALDGGNHAQFGSYGQQWIDRPATIAPLEQLSQTADELTIWLSTLL